MNRVLALNCGSSSLKWALFAGDDELERGSVDGIGAGGARDHAAAVAALFDELAARSSAPLRAVGHRIVHGGRDHSQPERVTEALLAALAEAIPFAPLHLPAELRVIAAVRERLGELPQVVSFDTGFHRRLPEVAQRFALPRSLFEAGVRRYGFHGLSYEYVVESLGQPPPRRAVIAHLGSGASMVAVRDGASIDTTMAFTPTAGLVMGTRSGDLDPGLAVYLLERCGYSARSFEQLVNHQSGLLALSETTSDMQRLLASRDSDPRAALAVDVFCYQATKWVGALTAALGGLDALVFTGGIGQHAPEIRERICRNLAHLGVSLDGARNRAGERIISAEGAACNVQVVATNEERMLARHTLRVLGRER
jgi:acetate kinase